MTRNQSRHHARIPGRRTALAVLAATTVVAAALYGTAQAPAQAPPQAPPPSTERLAFEDWLDRQAYEALAERRRVVQGIATAADVEARQAEVRMRLDAALGPIPATDAPLNARITRTQRRDGYRIEHVAFDSLPGYTVTALAYVPDGDGPFPAVLGTAGHSDAGKAHPLYQHAWISLARRGFVALAYDPPGQGERIEYPGATNGTSRVGIGVREHVMTGQQVLLTGRTLAGYMVQDGRRAVDYLLTRGDIDPARLAVAGNSGGGTQAAWLMAFEPRLAAAVVSCYMTSWQQLWRGPGPQDAEQVVPGFLARQLDFADVALAGAPRGFLVSSAIRDYFPIEGARACHAELRRYYALIGAPGRVAMVENDAPHGWSQPLREGAYRWLRAWLDGREAPQDEAPVTPDDPAQLQVTATGQLASSGTPQTTRGDNLAYARTLARTRPPATQARIRELAGLEGPPPTGRVVEREPVAGRPGTERLIVEVEPGVRLAGTLRRPTGTPPGGAAASPAVALVVDDRGTDTSADADALVAAGVTVLALDVRGTGALAPLVGASGYSPAYQFAARAWLLGTSVVGWQARDVLAGLDVLRGEVPGARTRAVHARGLTVPAALFAAQVDRPDDLVLSDGLVSYLDLAAADVYDDASLAIVPGMLTVTDLPELMALAAPARIVLRTPRTPTGAEIAPEALAARMGVAVPANVTR